MNKELFKKWARRYEKLDAQKKNIVLIVAFFLISMIMAEYLLFKSVDSFNQVSTARQETMEEKVRLLKQKEQIALANAQKTQSSLLKQKQDLSKEVDNLLGQSKSLSYVSAQKMPELIGKIINQVGSLNIIDFKNIPLEPSQSSGSILIKHSFSLNVSGSYQAIYDLVDKLKESGSVHLSAINLEKKDTTIVAQIDFYLINTNKSVMSFN